MNRTFARIAFPAALAMVAGVAAQSQAQAPRQSIPTAPAPTPPITPSDITPPPGYHVTETDPPLVVPNNPLKDPVEPAKVRIGKPYIERYCRILFRMGNPYTGPADPNHGQPYFGYGYVAQVDLSCSPFGKDAYYSPWYNNTSGTYYGPAAGLEQSLKVLHTPPSLPPAYLGR